MTKRFLAAASLSVALLGLVSLVWADKAAEVPYPEAYRGWSHVKSMVLRPGHELYDAFGGIHHVYANERALVALKAKKTFPDGSVFVFDLLGAVGDSTAIIEGPRKVVGVMHKDAAKFAATGGWGFEGFKGDTRERVVTDAKSGCFGCHNTGAKTSDFVFTEWRK